MAVAILLAAAWLFFGRLRPAQVRKGSRVRIHYSLTVDGKAVESSEGGKPLEFTQGAGEVVPGLDEALLGLKPGQERGVSVPPEKGYGRANPAAVRKVPLSSFQSQPVALKAGMTVEGMSGGRLVTGRVLRLEGQDAVLDMNHPLAGKTLEIRVRVVGVEGP